MHHVFVNPNALGPKRNEISILSISKRPASPKGMTVEFTNGLPMMYVHTFS